VQYPEKVVCSEGREVALDIHIISASGFSLKVLAPSTKGLLAGSKAPSISSSQDWNL